MKKRSYKKIKSIRPNALMHTVDYLLECGHVVTRKDSDLQPPTDLDGSWGDTKLSCPRCGSEFND